jgi:hypothetical protein
MYPTLEVFTEALVRPPAFNQHMQGPITFLSKQQKARACCRGNEEISVLIMATLRSSDAMT